MLRIKTEYMLFINYIHVQKYPLIKKYALLKT